MDWREPRIPSALVAERCGVTPQAVFKWRRDGKLDFRNIATLAKVTQVPMMFYLEEKRGETAETKAIWKRLRAFSTAAASMGYFAILPALTFLNPMLESVACVLCQTPPVSRFPYGNYLTP